MNVYLDSSSDSSEGGFFNKQRLKAKVELVSSISLRFIFLHFFSSSLSIYSAHTFTNFQARSRLQPSIIKAEIKKKIAESAAAAEKVRNKIGELKSMAVQQIQVGMEMYR